MDIEGLCRTIAPSLIPSFTAVPTMQEPPQPSTANIAAACAILAGVTGYMLGQAKSLGLFGGSAVSSSIPARKEKKKNNKKKDPAESNDQDTDMDEMDDLDDTDDDDDDEEEEDDSVPAEYNDHNEECKMVLVVRTDLGMTKGMHMHPLTLYLKQLF
jgi:PTH2 family peptidyl-tRNA hydrolase